MSYQTIADKLSREPGVEISTMMGSPCLRYNGNFMAMMFDKADSLIIKVPAERVNELIVEGFGNEFNFTKKRFKEWVLIPIEFVDKYENYIREALSYAKALKSMS